MDISWNVLVSTAVCAVFVQAVVGFCWVWVVWPRLRAREITKLMSMAFLATTPLVVAAGLVALIGRKPGDVVLAFSCALMWVGQLPFMFAGLPALEALLNEERRLADRARELAEVRDGKT